MNKQIRAAMLAAILARCKANGLAGWGQADSEAIIEAGLSASGLAPEAQLAIMAVMREHKLCNPSQALQRFTAAKLLPERPIRKRSAAPALSIGEELAALNAAAAE